MWHAANVAFTSKQRIAYNRWRQSLLLAYYQLSDALELNGISEGSDDSRPKQAFQRLRAVLDVIKQSPDLMSKR